MVAQKPADRIVEDRAVKRHGIGRPFAKGGVVDVLPGRGLRLVEQNHAVHVVEHSPRP